ncbi:hypothetical protein OG453_06930 [Streptomyces sp. NBC_01381]|uniref:hypothetical protein n=1 Tax=Streptomyces sp. NBC_01381 TaxID=2903845 RepID=UPI00224E2382|nr:hypothetical protein [Streptomyces sp. NBC_01381]MCX4666401.1 hypothetical protein [Streptomyces sp. NBC_01381]
MNQVAERAAFDWLARAQVAPEQAHREWTDQKVALLPLGERFCAIRLPTALVHGAFASDDMEAMAAPLADLLNGPLIRDHFGQYYYALIEPTPKERWAYNNVAPLLGAGTYLGVPAASRREAPGIYWIVPPRFADDLCAPKSVAALIAIGRSLSGEDEQ